MSTCGGRPRVAEFPTIISIFLLPDIFVNVGGKDVTSACVECGELLRDKARMEQKFVQKQGIERCRSH